eukprot:GHVU01086665.1.p1 GENE.GHVU01086665.1~~GHVU01086665.1.p1  ORF type:complete len:123 (-),score=8.53 GHVU01086665.1:180-548(-)
MLLRLKLRQTRVDSRIMQYWLRSCIDTSKPASSTTTTRRPTQLQAATTTLPGNLRLIFTTRESETGDGNGVATAGPGGIGETNTSAQGIGEEGDATTGALGPGDIGEATTKFTTITSPSEVT